MLDLFTDRESYGDTLRVRVTPKASTDRIKVEEQANGERLIRVYVTVVAEDGKANKRVLELLAKELGISKTSLTIVQGITSRDKVIRVNQ